MRNSDKPAMPVGEQMDGMNLNPICNGLTKREHFAAMAMQGLCAAESGDGQYTKWIDLAFDAVIISDALLAALEADNESN